MRRTALAGGSLAATLLLLLTGCGGDPSAADDPVGSPSTTATTATTSSPATATPACADLWVDGHTIPEHYTGCTDDGRLVKAAKRLCESGQTVVTYAGRYYGVLGGPANDVGSLETSAVYQKVLRSCH